MLKKLILLSALAIIAITLGSGCSSSADPSVSEGDGFNIKFVNITHAQDRYPESTAENRLVNITVAELNLTNIDNEGKKNRSFYLSRPYFSDSNDVKHYVLYDFITRWVTKQYPYLDNYMSYDDEGNLACSYGAISLAPGESTKVYIPFEYTPTKTDKLCFDLITDYDLETSYPDEYKYSVNSITLSLD